VEFFVVVVRRVVLVLVFVFVVLIAAVGCHEYFEELFEAFCDDYWELIGEYFSDSGSGGVGCDFGNALFV
jgi:hypothetical protein